MMDFDLLYDTIHAAVVHVLQSTPNVVGRALEDERSESFNGVVAAPVHD